jgi:hypothetical protein
VGWTAGIQILAGAGDFSLLHSIQTRSGDHPTSYPVGTGAGFPRLKWLGCEADHLPSSSAEVKNGGTIPPLSHMFSSAQGQLYLYLTYVLSLPKDGVIRLKNKFSLNLLKVNPLKFIFFFQHTQSLRE